LKLLPKILPTEDEEDRRLDQRVVFEQPEPQPRENRLHWGWTLAVATVAAIPRLLYLFAFTNPQNPGDGLYGDVWHHWQIAYLTKEIGLSAPGGPRLWDLKGLDYFWGVLHPLLMVAVYDVTGSIDIVLNRLVSLAFGVVVVVLLFHICRRYWGTQTAVGVALAASLLPTSVMNDASGMLEPLGVALCLAGIWAWGRGKGFWAGLAFGLSTMARAEAWIFGLGMVVAAHLRRTESKQRAPLVIGFAGVVVLDMILLLNKTGNPIYPLWWNFFANATGKWGTAITADQVAVRPTLAAILLAAVVGLAWTLWRRPPSYMLLTFGFGYWVFTAVMFGFTSFLSTWLWWTPISRRFEFPFVFASVLIAVALLWWAPRKFGKGAIPLGWLTLVGALLAAQVAWIPIANAFGPTETTWRSTLAESRQLSAWYNAAPYQGHALAVPPDRPDITYGLARFGGVEGKHLVSEMYDPFAYLPVGFKIADHESTVSTLVQCWISETDIHMIAVQENDANLALVEQLNPGWFTDIGTMQEAQWMVKGVSVPKPSAGDCTAARSATASS
jgi:Dolichyl-phosphate-mannose-protein mannosyltransferase